MADSGGNPAGKAPPAPREPAAPPAPPSASTSTAVDPTDETMPDPGALKRLASIARCDPDFVIIGAQKGGTTSLCEYLFEHPSIVGAARKEVHFFDINFYRGRAWYREHFPPLSRRWLRQVRGRRLVTGEASPYYLFHPAAARRMAATLRRPRLIALLRNPVDRAYSQYQHSLRRGSETLSFEAALDAEADRLRGEEDRLAEDPTYYSLAHQRLSYRTRGIYADQVRRWFDHFPRQQFLILRAEDFFADPATALRKVVGFLELDPWEPEAFGKFNYHGRYPPMDPATRERLTAFYAPHNRRLYDLLGQDLGW